MFRDGREDQRPVFVSMPVMACVGAASGVGVGVGVGVVAIAGAAGAEATL
jgi:hypothetical protein